MAYRNASNFSQSLSAVSLGKAQSIKEFSSWHFVTTMELCARVNRGRLDYAQHIFTLQMK